MSYVMVDVEADGPIPGDYSMVCLGAVIVEPTLEKTFYGRLQPVSDEWVPQALAVSGFSRDETLGFDEPREVMESFAAWVTENSSGRPMFVSDNNGFDWQFVNWYFHHFTGGNPFGFSSTNLGSLYKPYRRHGNVHVSRACSIQRKRTSLSRGRPARGTGTGPAV